MSIQYSVFFLTILKMRCYASLSESDRQFGNTSISAVPLPYLDEIKFSNENNFPDVEYPTKVLDTIEPFYYRVAGHDGILEPFTDEVKNSYNAVEAKRKTKENSVHQDRSNTPTELDVQSIVECDSHLSDVSFDQVENQHNLTTIVITGDTGDWEAQDDYLISGEQEVQFKGFNSEEHSDNSNIDTTYEDSNQDLAQDSNRTSFISNYDTSKSLSEEIVSLDYGNQD